MLCLIDERRDEFAREGTFGLRGAIHGDGERLATHDMHMEMDMDKAHGYGRQKHIT